MMDEETVKAVIKALKRNRSGKTLRGLSVKEMIEDGRRQCVGFVLDKMNKKIKLLCYTDGVL